MMNKPKNFLFLSVGSNGTSVVKEAKPLVLVPLLFSRERAVMFQGEVNAPPAPQPPISQKPIHFKTTYCYHLPGASYFIGIYSTLCCGNGNPVMRILNGV